MAVLACTLDCIAGGFSKITISFESEQTGSNTDNFAMRIVRRPAGSSTGGVVLPGEPEFIMTGNRDIRSFAFIDPNIPTDGDYTYTLQINRINGGGTFHLMMMTAEHFKR